MPSLQDDIRLIVREEIEAAFARHATPRKSKPVKTVELNSAEHIMLKWNSFVDEMKEAYPNGNYQHVKVLSAAQKKQTTERLAEPGFDLDAIFNEVRQSAFLRGERPPSEGHKQFVWRFGFVFERSSRWADILNGKYRDPEEAKPDWLRELEEGLIQNDPDWQKEHGK